MCEQQKAGNMQHGKEALRSAWLTFRYIDSKWNVHSHKRGELSLFKHPMHSRAIHTIRHHMNNRFVYALIWACDNVWSRFKLLLLLRCVFLPSKSWKGGEEKGAHHSWKMHNASSFVLQQIATENAEKKNTGGDEETSTSGRLMCALAAINSDD